MTSTNNKPTTAAAAKKTGPELGADQQLIVEEKIVKANGECVIKKYSKGRFLGKVPRLFFLGFQLVPRRQQSFST